MGWLEWLGESMDPRSWGSVTFGVPHDNDDVDGPSVPGVIIRFAVAAGVLTTTYYLLFAYVLPLTWKAFGITFAILLVYLLTSCLVRPEPEMDNLGWLGGLMDDPFHYSDDTSRFLLFHLIVLWPGRFLAGALVGLVRLAFGHR
jgi:hypothetical protein